MNTRLLSACALALAIALLFSAVVAQGTEARTPLSPVAETVSAGSMARRSMFPALPGFGPLSEIAATLSFTSYLPVVINMPPPCTVAPTLSSPANGSTLNTIIPTFQWNAGSDLSATTTVLEIAKDSGFTQVALRLWYYTGQGILQWEMYNNLDPATIYYWRTHLLCSSNLESPYSPVWTFVTGSGGVILPPPALIAPANGSTVSSSSVNLQWSPVSGATKYLVRRRKAGETSTSSFKLTGTQTTVTLSPSTTYQWWVYAQNAYAIGSPSTTWQFTTPAGDARPLERASDVFVTDDGAVTVVGK